MHSAKTNQGVRIYWNATFRGNNVCRGWVIRQDCYEKCINGDKVYEFVYDMPSCTKIEVERIGNIWFNIFGDACYDAYDALKTSGLIILGGIK